MHCILSWGYFINQNRVAEISIICGFKISGKNLKLQEYFIRDLLLKNKNNSQLEVFSGLKLWPTGTVFWVITKTIY